MTSRGSTVRSKTDEIDEFLLFEKELQDVVKLTTKTPIKPK